MSGTCEIHPGVPTVTTQHWTRCRSCENARKNDWRRKRRAAGLLPEQNDAARAARRDSYAWRQVHAAYHVLCDRMGIAMKETS